MPLTNFVWENEVTVQDGVRGVAGTAKAPDGHIIELFVTEEVLLELDEQECRSKMFS